MVYYPSRIKKLVKEYLKLPEEVRQEFEKSVPRKEVEQREDISYRSSFVELQQTAEELAKKWKKNVSDVQLEHSCYQQDYSDSWSSEAHLEVMVLETDDQYHSRLAEQYESVKLREEYERNEFKRLSAKFTK